MRMKKFTSKCHSTLLMPKFLRALNLTVVLFRISWLKQIFLAYQKIFLNLLKKSSNSCASLVTYSMSVFSSWHLLSCINSLFLLIGSLIDYICSYVVLGSPPNISIYFCLIMFRTLSLTKPIFSLVFCFSLAFSIIVVRSVLTSLCRERNSLAKDFHVVCFLCSFALKYSLSERSSLYRPLEDWCLKGTNVED